MTPYYSDSAVTLYHGDCLDILDVLCADPEFSIDAVVMDPPYASGTRKEMGKSSSGAMLRGERFANRPIENDQMTTQGFVWLMRAATQRMAEALVDGGAVLSFIDWRQWPNLVGAFETCNLRIQSMVVWDKGSIGMGNGFRRQHELVCHASKGVPNVHNHGIGDVITCGREAPVDHPSPKPVELVGRLLDVVAAPGALVVDPFAGAGSTLVAAKARGVRSIGIEIEERYCEIAAKRLGQEVLDLGAA